MYNDLWAYIGITVLIWQNVNDPFRSNEIVRIVRIVTLE